MEPIIVLPAKDLELLITQFEQVTNRLIAADRELALLKADGYVNWDWVCVYLNVSEPVARQMLQNEKVLVYGRKVKKFRRSDIVRFAERHSVKLKDLPA